MNFLIEDTSKMFNFKNHQDNLPFLHGELFTLEWAIPEAKWVMVFFKNGQTKPWYKKIERPYRFKRKFRKKANDSFSNLANFKHPYIVFYVFTHLFSWPKKIIVPMQVNHLIIHDLPLQTSNRSLIIRTPNASVDLKIPRYFPALKSIYKEDLTISLNPPLFDLNTRLRCPKCDWSLSEMHDSGLLTHENYTFELIQQIANKS